mgnify:CR=1 FL=1
MTDKNVCPALPKVYQSEHPGPGDFGFGAPSYQDRQTELRKHLGEINDYLDRNEIELFLFQSGPTAKLILRRADKTVELPIEPKLISKSRLVEVA